MKPEDKVSPERALRSKPVLDKPAEIRAWLKSETDGVHK